VDFCTDFRLLVDYHQRIHSDRAIQTHPHTIVLELLVGVVAIVEVMTTGPTTAKGSAADIVAAHPASVVNDEPIQTPTQMATGALIITSMKGRRNKCVHSTCA
jgi:hypothetical protein